jgi:hypothetical protein
VISAHGSLLGFGRSIQGTVLIRRLNKGIRQRAFSDMLLPSTAEEMTRRSPKAELVEFAGVGHLPALLTLDQIAPITAFLSNPRTGWSLNQYAVPARQRTPSKEAAGC